MPGSLSAWYRAKRIITPHQGRGRGWRVFYVPPDRFARLGSPTYRSAGSKCTQGGRDNHGYCPPPALQQELEAKDSASSGKRKKPARRGHRHSPCPRPAPRAARSAPRGAGVPPRPPQRRSTEGTISPPGRRRPTPGPPRSGNRRAENGRTPRPNPPAGPRSPPASGVGDTKPAGGSAVPCPAVPCPAAPCPAAPASLPRARSGVHLSAGGFLLRAILPVTPAQQRGWGGGTQPSSGAINPPPSRGSLSLRRSLPAGAAAAAAAAE